LFGPYTDTTAGELWPLVRPQGEVGATELAPLRALAPGMATLTCWMTLTCNKSIV